MDVRRLPIADLTVAYYNPRKDLKPGDEEYELLAKGIHEFGLVEPLVWNEVTGRLVGGHQRLKVLIANGETEADVSVVHIEDEAKEKALNIALNKISGDWDRPTLKDVLEELDTGALDMELTGFTEAALEQLMSAFMPEDEWGDALGKLGEGDKTPFQQMTFTLHDTQAEEVNRALDLAKKIAPFTDSPNENSNGNALARVCEEYVTRHGCG